ncbi:MAG: hypothetical protein FJX65_16505 [Alphaproteobacteria bacterium]|nr:hypothetical protein [Alphaproteobacteria bacterium]
MKTIIVHSLVHARAALEAARDCGQPVRLLTPPNGARYAGPLFYWEVVKLAERESGHSAAATMIDCGPDAGVALSALRCGWRTIAFTGARDARAKLASIAEQSGGVVVARVPAALDLLDEPKPDAACRGHLRP